jgi:crossover junction endodeoxyribonuclease RuvC
MRILGVDPGTHHFGYGVIETDGREIESRVCGVIEGGSSKEIGERLHKIHLELVTVVNSWEPDHFALEEPFVAPRRGAKSAIAVGQAQAIALMIAASCQIPVHRYFPSQVKSAIANYGAGSKAQLQRAVQLVLGLGTEPLSEDASDALAVALCHIQQWQLRERVPQ